MQNFEGILRNEKIVHEYKMALLLNMFKKICFKMNKDTNYKKRIKTLYMESYNSEETTKTIFNKEFNFELSDSDAQNVSKWFLANFRKGVSRKRIPDEIKIELYKKQKGKCVACGEDLGDLSKIHVDHIIPWKLVGDELDNNYQDLCEKCNECKSDSIDYIFRSLINLI